MSKSKEATLATSPLAKARLNVQISAPAMKTLVLEIEGTAPLVVHRFSIKSKREMVDKVTEGTKKNAGKKIHKARNPDDIVNEARYISPQGWDGFNVASLRNAMVRACVLCNIKMTLAKMCVFVLADGRDKFEPQFGLIRIYGKMRRQDDIGRVATGEPYAVFRPAYDDWRAKLRIRYDSDQFTAKDIVNLIARVGEQVGLCEGRPFSTNSAGMGWGTFIIAKESAA